MAGPFAGLLPAKPAAMPMGKEPEGAADPEGPGDDELAELMPIADDLIAAVKSGDSSGVAAALKAAYASCGGGGDME